MAKMTTRAAKGMGKGDKSGAGAGKGDKKGKGCKGGKKGKGKHGCEDSAQNKMSGSGSGSEMAAGLMAEGGVKTTHIAAAGGSMFAIAGVLIVVGLALKSRKEANTEVQETTALLHADAAIVSV